MEKEREEMIQLLVRWYKGKIKELDDECEKSVLDMCKGDKDKAATYLFCDKTDGVGMHLVNTESTIKLNYKKGKEQLEF